MSLQSGGRDLLREAIREVVLFTDDREIVTLRAPRFRGLARIAGPLSGYEARSGSGGLLFAGSIGEGLTATSGFIEQGAEVRLSELEVV